MGFSLRNLLADITGNHPTTPVQAPTSAPSLADYTRAMIDMKPQNLPQDNLDGTYTNLQPGRGAIVQVDHWKPPMPFGSGTSVPYFAPLAKGAGEYDESNYFAVPINPNVVPQPMQPLQRIGM